MKPLRLAGLAQEELREAFNWYEEQGEGLGRRFVMAVDRTFADLVEQPHQYPVVHKNTRRAIVKPFPYGVFFEDHTDYVSVVAIVHLHRHPDTSKRRC